MENTEGIKAKRLTSLVFLLVIVILLAIGFAMSLVFDKHGSLKTVATTNKTAISNRKILFDLYDSGSSDIPSWNLKVYTDGSGLLSNPTTVFSDGTFDARNLMQSLNKTNLKNFNESCDSSFSQTLTYKSQVTKNINCYIAKSKSAALSKQLSSVINKVDTKITTN